MNDVVKCTDRPLLPFFNLLQARISQAFERGVHRNDIVQDVLDYGFALQERLATTLLSAGEQAMHSSKSKLRDANLHVAFNAICISQRYLKEEVEKLGGKIP